ncbi:phosphatase PAP2 family protein [Candidatus Saccharibacteria bacterium]|nr:phosphatase PAP2 family protein [Candidatus Saccharibacteria bacterium]
MQWETITNIILISALITVGFFAVLGLYQWVTRKSLKKVDPEILWMPLPLLLMTIVYFIFIFFPVATRPNGSGESSFPSTHVMVVTTIYFMITIIIPKYIKSTAIQIALEFIIVIFISLTCTGRIMAELHSLWDVIGGIIFAFIFSEIYYLAYRKGKKKNAKRVYQNHKR